MRRTRVLQVATPLAAAAVVVGAAAAFGDVGDDFTKAQAPTGTVAYLKAADDAGPIQGPVTTKAHAGAIPVTALDFGVNTPVDAGTGLPTGPMICDGVSFRKPVDATTPIWYSMSASNDLATTAEFDEYNTSNAALVTLSVTLLSSRVTTVHTVDGGRGGLNYDDITLRPQQVKIGGPFGRQTATFNCNGHAS